MRTKLSSFLTKVSFNIRRTKTILRLFFLLSANFFNIIPVPMGNSTFAVNTRMFRHIIFFEAANRHT